MSEENRKVAENHLLVSEKNFDLKRMIKLKTLTKIKWASAAASDPREVSESLGGQERPCVGPRWSLDEV